MRRTGPGRLVATSLALVVALALSATATAAGSPRRWVPTSGTARVAATSCPGEGKIEHLGSSIAVTGSLAVVGIADETDLGEPFRGVADVLTDGPGGWAQTAQLTAADGDKFDGFGDAVAASPTTVVVSATNKGNGPTGSGTVYLFTEQAGGWTQAAELPHPFGTYGFGAELSMSGRTIVVGASQSAFVVVRSGRHWQVEGALPALQPVPMDFGSAVSVFGHTIVVGAPAASDGGVSQGGAAYVFTESAGVWALAATLLPPNPTPNGLFGYTVCADGSTVVVGAPGQSGNGGTEQGAAFVFVRHHATWTETQELTGGDEGLDEFGVSVSAVGPTLVVGSPEHAVGENAGEGAGYVFSRVGGVWTQVAELDGSDSLAGDNFGQAVTVSGDGIGVGAVWRNPDAVYLFSGGGADWVQSFEFTDTS
ncbi:MAG TPA: hypothetical protein VK277_07960 [Acidimicrobiales bacterium]|nr:hypothetical protein [Acidimicrobiales bacterium]